MRRVLLSLLSAGLLATGASAQSLVNGDFESPAGTNSYDGAGWTVFDTVGTRESWSAHQDLRGGYFPGWTGDGVGGLYQDVALTNGTYTFAVWIFRESGFNDQNSVIKMEWYDANTNVLQSDSVTDLTTAPVDAKWHLVHVTGTCDSNDLAFARCTIYSDWGANNPGNSSFMFDDAQLYQGSFTGTAARLQNQSFEAGDGGGFRGTAWYSNPELDGDDRGGYRVWWANFASATGLSINSFAPNSNHFESAICQNVYIPTGTYTFSVWVRREDYSLIESFNLALRTFDSTLTNELQSVVTNLTLPPDYSWREYHLTASLTNASAYETRICMEASWFYNSTSGGSKATMMDEARFYTGEFQPHLVTDWAYHNNTNLDAQVEQIPGTGGYGSFLQVNYATTTTTFYILANNPSVANRADESADVAIRTTWLDPVTFLWQDEYNTMAWVANITIADTNQFHGTPLAGSKTLDLWRYQWPQPLDTNGVPYTNAITVYYAPYIRTLLNGTETEVRWLVAKEGEVTNSWISNPQILASQFANIDFSYVNQAPASADSDNDGMPDWWELTYLGVLTNEASGDADSDGSSNYDEWIADSNPNLWGSFTNIPAIFNGSVFGTMLINLQDTSTARVYDVLATTNLTDSAGWQAYGLTATGSGGIMTLTVTNDLPYRSYRARVRIP